MVHIPILYTKSNINKITNIYRFRDSRACRAVSMVRVPID